MQEPDREARIRNHDDLAVLFDALQHRGFSGGDGISGSYWPFQHLELWLNLSCQLDCSNNKHNNHEHETHQAQDRE